MTVEANAKINLTLEVYATRPDGYHSLPAVDGWLSRLGSNQD